MKSSMPRMIAVTLIACLALAGLASAATIEPSDGATDDYFGYSVSQSGTIGLVGARYHETGGVTDRGAAYLYRGLDSASGTVNQNAKLIASDGAAYDNFGFSVAVLGTTGLVGAYGHDTNGNDNQGAAYLYRGLDTATGTVNQNATLIASDGEASDSLGSAVSLSGTTGLVGAHYRSDAGYRRGAAYVYRGLDTATGTVTENAELIASDATNNDNFGGSVSQSGTIGLIGARGTYVANVNDAQGAAYVYRGLDTATGTVTENVKLTASDGAERDFFGHSVSLSGTMGLVGAWGHDTNGNGNQGAAYLYKNLDTASGTKTENAKLIASDGEASDSLGSAVSLSGTTGLVGAYYRSAAGHRRGAAYIYQNLDTATGTVTESVKLIASDAVNNDVFGASASLDGDLFTVGANQGTIGGTGKAYTGSVSSMTTLDDGSTKVISGISFESRNDWIVGQNSSNNQVTLTAGDAADVTETGMAVYVGQNNGSNANTLVIDGDLTANAVYVGNGANTGNILTGSGTITGDVTNEGIIAPGNSPGTLSVDGNVGGNGDYLMEIASAGSYDQLAVTGAMDFDGSVIDVNLLGGYTPGIGDTFTLFSGTLSGTYSFDFADAGGAAAWDTSNFLTTGAITSIPEPATMSLLGAGAIGLLVRRKRK